MELKDFLILGLGSDVFKVVHVEVVCVSLLPFLPVLSFVSTGFSMLYLYPRQ